MKNSALAVAGIVFTLVALMHLLRLFYHWEIIIAGKVIPMSTSIAALIVSIILALWMYSAALMK